MLFVGFYVIYLGQGGEDQKALQFIYSHKDSPGTLLQAIVNTLSKTRFQENSTRVHFNEFYSVLERELKLEQGKLLLALGSPSQLESHSGERVAILGQL